jgi:predicted site-specific integrase-resolvase
MKKGDEVNFHTNHGNTVGVVEQVNNKTVRIFVRSGKVRRMCSSSRRIRVVTEQSGDKTIKRHIKKHNVRLV